MKASRKKGTVLGDFSLRFHAKSINLSRQPQNLLKIYLQKNVQVLGQVGEIVNTHQLTLKYEFSNDLRPIEFRVTSPKNCQYQLSLYEILDDQTEKFLTSSPLSLSSFLKEYEQEFRRMEDRLQVEMRQNVKEGLPQLWRGIRQKISRKSLKGTAHFQPIKASLEYELVPFHDYDQVVRLDDIQKEKQKEKLAKANFHRTSTLPTIPKNFKFGPNRASVPTITLAPPSPKASPDSLLQKSKTAMKQDFIQFNKKLEGKDLMNIPEKVQQKISKSQLEAEPQSDFVGKLQLEALDLDDRLQDEELRQAGILPQPEKAEEQDTIEEEGHLAVDRHRSLLSPNTLGIVSLKSHDTSKGVEAAIAEGPPSKVKEYVLTFVMTVVGGFMTVFLMHPVSKTG